LGTYAEFSICKKDKKTINTYAATDLKILGIGNIECKLENIPAKK
jgi:hypothetical protein